ncbi:MAG: 2-succinyl-6-hydroxy-2,4-cyclohexadiene-1-carboxylate synthase [Chloroflexi bacterium]|nr:2-succinyl-6-hydroxy-2,4-cyclohexadiene-1-carboxylate synthase [Chloroflexota bacterium]
MRLLVACRPAVSRSLRCRRNAHATWPSTARCGAPWPKLCSQLALPELNGLDFHVEIEGAGAPLLLLHGFTGSIRSWDGIRSNLARDARLIAVDLIGHGQSASPADASRYTLDWCTRDLAALLDHLGLQRANVLGYSMGGRAALHLAVHAPSRVQTLILESASPGLEDPPERHRRVLSDEALAQRILANGIDAFVAEWEAQPLLALQPHVSAGVRQQQRELRLRNNPVGLANSLRGMGAGAQKPLWSRLSELSVPVHLIVGAADTRYAAIAQRMAQLFQHARVSVVPDAGHTVHLDQPQAFAVIVDAAREKTNRVTPADFPLSTN